jgi:nicotinate-nucleotide adenylyltransferase
MPVWYLVPDGVVQYIEKRGLYHAGPPRRRLGDGAADGRPAGDRPTYDRQPPGADSRRLADGDPPSSDPPPPHVLEVPR